MKQFLYRSLICYAIIATLLGASMVRSAYANDIHEEAPAEFNVTDANDDDNSPDSQPATPAAAPTEKIALLLPLQGKLSGPGNAIRDGFMQAYFQNPNRAKIGITVYDTAGNLRVKDLYQQAVREGATVIVGPLDKPSVEELQKHAGDNIPIIALNDTTSRSRPARFYQFGLNPQDEAQQIAQTAQQHGHHRALIIAPKGEWGQTIVQQFRQQWQTPQNQIVAELNFDNQSVLSNDVQQVLLLEESNKRHAALEAALAQRIKFQPSRRQDVDMIFLVANPDVARQIVPLLKYYYAGDIPVYATSHVFQGAAADKSERDLEGVRFCDIPWVNAPATTTASNYPRLFALGLDAFNLVQHLPDLNGRNFSLIGNTGTLLLDPENHIHRQLVLHQIKNGVPQSRQQV